jgi:hypothetical protein
MAKQGWILIVGALIGGGGPVGDSPSMDDIDAKSRDAMRTLLREADGQE